MHRRSPRPLIRGADIYVVLILGVLLAALLSGNFLKFLTFLYSPVIILVVITICVTYLFFKSADRSRAYKDELEMIRSLRKRDAVLRRDLERRLQQLLMECAAGDGEALDAERRQRIYRELESIINELRKS
ncbi:MAG: hypothetical protein Kow0059_04130 [Candidatus Sumerlaeia bacterium]